MIDGKKFFDQPINSNLKTFENIRKIASDQEDDYTPGCLLDYSYFNNHYKMIAVDFFMEIQDQFNKLILQ